MSTAEWMFHFDSLKNVRQRDLNEHEGNIVKVRQTACIEHRTAILERVAVELSQRPKVAIRMTDHVF